MNEYQKIYCDTYYGGKKPRTKIGKHEYELLGNIKSYVIVNLPGGPKELKVTSYDNNIPEGIISVCTLATNLTLWLSRGYKVTTHD